MTLIADTKIIMLNSLYSAPTNSYGTYQKSYLSNVTFNTKNILTNDPNIVYTTVAVDNACIPHSFYNINYTSNILIIAVPNTLVTYTITLTRGHYNIKTLLSELTYQINASGFFTVVISFDTITGKLSFKMNKPFIFNSTFLGSTMLETIGFDNKITYYSDTNFTLITDHSMNLIGIKMLKIVSTALQTNSLSSQADGSFSQQNILTIIPVTAPEYELITYNNNNNIDPILINKTVNSIDIIFYDEQNNFINFNNTEWSLNLRITSYREIELNNTSTITQLLNDNALGKSDIIDDSKKGEFGDIDYLLYQKGIDIQ